jgi:hypothetical protein
MFTTFAMQKLSRRLFINSALLLSLVAPVCAQNAQRGKNTASASLEVHAIIVQVAFSSNIAQPRSATSSTIDFNLPTQSQMDVRRETRPFIASPLQPGVGNVALPMLTTITVVPQ